MSETMAKYNVSEDNLGFEDQKEEAITDSDLAEELESQKK